MPANAKANRSVTEMVHSLPNQAKTQWPVSRLRKHADYQRVYKASRKQFSNQMSYFFALRPALGPDGTLRRQLPLLESPVDLVLHPKRSVLDLDFATLEREVAAVFRAVQKAAQKQLPTQPEPAKT